MGVKIGGKLADYDVVISEAFRRLRASKKEADYYDFDKSLLERVVEELGRSKKISKPIKNIPDIKYTYDARKNFPTEISRTGFWAITGRGKSKAVDQIAGNAQTEMKLTASPVEVTVCHIARLV